MNNYICGILYFFAGFKYLGTKGLKRYIVLPILFNCILFVSLFYFSKYYILPYSYDYISLLPSWLSFLASIFFIIFLISFLLFFLSTFSIFLNLIAAPFNGLLAEKTQALLFHSAIQALPFHTIAIRSIKRQCQFLIYFLPRLIMMGLLFFVPFIHPFYPFLWFIFNAWMLNLQYQDFVMDNNLFEFKEMREQLNNKRMLSLGFGSIINVFNFIPFLNLVVMPVAVIGGVLLFCDNNKQLLSLNNSLLTNTKT